MANIDFTGIANLQNQQATQNTATQTQANRPNQNTPWGSTNWTQNPDGSWTQNQSLNPTLQNTLTGQQQIGADRTTAAGNLSGQVADATANPVDYGQFMAGGDRVNGGNYYNDAATNAVRSKFDLWNNDQNRTDQDALETQLRNRGMTPGDPGYDQQLRLLRETQGKLRNDANLNAILTGGQEGSRMQGMDISAGNYNTGQRETQIAEALRKRGQPLADQNALLSGTEVTPPNMPSFTQAEQAPAPNLLGAAGMNYAQRQDNKTRDADLMGTILQGVSGGGGLSGIGKTIGGLFGGGAAPAAAGTVLNGIAGPMAVGGTAAGAAGGGGLMSGILGGVGTAAKAVGSGISGLFGGGAGAGASTAAAGAATGGSSLVGGLAAAAPWVGAALAVGAVAANNMKKSSPLDGFNPSAGFTKPAHFDGQTFPPEALNAYFGPALAKFAATGDAKAALAALPQPKTPLEAAMLKGGAKALFGGTGNPFRQIAKARGFRKGIWTASNKDKRGAIKALGG